ncbi:MAG TPA: hypothetical protein V6C57_02820 [Coleofasciculaceae cyanobacterium]
MKVDTYGNRHRLTIKDAIEGQDYVLDSGSDEQGKYTRLSMPGVLDLWDEQIAASLIARAFKAGAIEPRHVYRVPVWAKLSFGWQQKLFNLFQGVK